MVPFTIMSLAAQCKGTAISSRPHISLKIKERDHGIRGAVNPGDAYVLVQLENESDRKPIGSVTTHSTTTVRSGVAMQTRPVRGKLSSNSHEPRLAGSPHPRYPCFRECLMLSGNLDHAHLVAAFLRGTRVVAFDLTSDADPPVVAGFFEAHHSNLAFQCKRFISRRAARWHRQQAN